MKGNRERERCDKYSPARVELSLTQSCVRSAVISGQIATVERHNEAIAEMMMSKIFHLETVYRNRSLAGVRDKVNEKSWAQISKVY